MTAPGRRTLIAAGIAAYVFLLLANFPARLAARWFTPDSVSVAAPEGTLWSGHAASLVAGTIVTGATRWRVRPLALLTGRLSADLDVRLDGGQVTGRAALTPGGRWHLRQVAGVVPLSTLGAIVPGSSYDGRIGLDVSDATLEDNWLVDANGTIDIVDLRMIFPADAALGSYEVAFAGADEASLVGRVRDVQANFGIEGTVTLHRDRRWEIDCLVMPQRGAPEQIVRALSQMTVREADGRYRLSLANEI